METLAITIFFKDGTNQVIKEVVQYGWTTDVVFLWLKFNKKAVNKKGSSGFTSDQRWFRVDTIERIEATCYESTT